MASSVEKKAEKGEKNPPQNALGKLFLLNPISSPQKILFLGRDQRSVIDFNRSPGRVGCRGNVQLCRIDLPLLLVLGAAKGVIGRFRD